MFVLANFRGLSRLTRVPLSLKASKWPPQIDSVEKDAPHFFFVIVRSKCGRLKGLVQLLLGDGDENYH